MIYKVTKIFLIQAILIFITSGLMLTGVYAGQDSKSILILDFELKDLTIYDSNQEELERTSEIKAILESELRSLTDHQIVEFDDIRQQQADIGQGYLYDHINLAAEFGNSENAQWVVVGRVHKPSYLFQYLKAKLINVWDAKLVAEFTVEVKGSQDKFIKKGIHRLASQISNAISHGSE